jgi:hypothetical protein
MHHEEDSYHDLGVRFDLPPVRSNGLLGLILVS